MNLTKAQIEQLFDFVRSKNVHYLDVQHEIVDHLASSIENIQRQNPATSFSSALTQSYSNFPITGFAELIETKEAELRKYWRRRFWRFLYTIISPPRVILTVSAFLIFSYLFGLIGDISISGSESYLWIKQLIYQSLIAFGPMFLCIIYRLSKGIKPPSEYQDILLTSTYWKEMEPLLYSFATIPAYIWIVMMHPQEGIINMTGLANYILSYLYTGIIVCAYVAYHVFPEMLSQEISDRYKHLDASTDYEKITNH